MNINYVPGTQENRTNAVLDGKVVNEDYPNSLERSLVYFLLFCFVDVHSCGHLSNSGCLHSKLLDM